MTTLQSPSSCFIGISCGEELATATLNLTRLSSLASLAIQSVSAPALYSLTIELYSNELDILMRVAISFPNLRKLKLNEIRRSAVS